MRESMSLNVSGSITNTSLYSKPRGGGTTSEDDRSFKLEKSPQDKKGGLNEKALSVVNRVKEKLTGKFRLFNKKKVLKFLFGVLMLSFCLTLSLTPQPGTDFQKDQTLSVESQVSKLIVQATSLQNLCQGYYQGWCVKEKTSFFLHYAGVLFIDETGTNIFYLYK
jgi:hypothetical protein